jgi:hypothetical protein
LPGLPADGERPLGVAMVAEKVFGPVPRSLSNATNAVTGGPNWHESRRFSTCVIPPPVG